MKEIFDYLEEHKATAIIFIVGLLLVFGLVIRMKSAPTPMQAGLSGFGTSSPTRSARYLATSMAQASPLQLAALGSNTLTLPMGVVLEGKGTVISVDPGSSAERAGIQPGDLINRINGR